MKTKKKKGFVYTLKQNKVAYAYIAPFYILFAIFGLFPIVAGFGLSFLRWDGIGPMHFNGVTNYINLFKDPLFWKALSNTLLIGIIAHIPILLPSSIYAYIGILGGIGVGFSAQYGWQAVFNTFGALAIAAESYGLKGAVSLRVIQNVFGVVFALAFCAVFYWFMSKQKESDVTVHAE